MIRAALARAGLKPREVGYIEAHGTGTQLGDPLEIQALGGRVPGGPRSATPLVIGSVKTNVGHLEAAAGVTGLIKLILALRHKRDSAASPHDGAESHIDWTAMPLKVADSLMPWDRSMDAGSAASAPSASAAPTRMWSSKRRRPKHRRVRRFMPSRATAHLFVLSARDAPALAVHAGPLRRGNRRICRPRSRRYLPHSEFRPFALCRTGDHHCPHDR